MWISKRNYLSRQKRFKKTVSGSNQAGRFILMLWNQGRTALFSRRFIPKGGQCHTNLLLITLLCEWCSIILLFLAGWAPHKAAKARLWWRWWQMASSLGLVLILPFQMSAFKKYIYARDTTLPDECSVAACINTAHSAGEHVIYSIWH